MPVDRSFKSNTWVGPGQVTMERRMRALRMIPMTLAIAACTADGGGGDGCVQVDAACAPLYTPVFDELHTRTLAPTCAVPGGSCHAAAGAQGGLVLEDPDTAFGELLGTTTSGGVARVVPGDPGCSEVVRRVFAGGSQGMPPGAPLSDAETCVFVQWIDAGAER